MKTFDKYSNAVLDKLQETWNHIHNARYSVADTNCEDVSLVEIVGIIESISKDKTKDGEYFSLFYNNLPCSLYLDCHLSDEQFLDAVQDFGGHIDMCLLDDGEANIMKVTGRLSSKFVGNEESIPAYDYFITTKDAIRYCSEKDLEICSYLSNLNYFKITGLEIAPVSFRSFMRVLRAIDDAGNYHEDPVLKRGEEMGYHCVNAIKFDKNIYDDIFDFKDFK